MTHNYDEHYDDHDNDHDHHDHYSHETSRVAFRLLTVPAMFDARQWQTPLSISWDANDDTNDFNF